MGRWDITGIKNMKKSIFTLLLFFAFSLFSYAQDAKTSCKMPGTYDYVSADFYKGRSEGTGKIRLTNQATIPVLEIKVKVTCELDSHIDSQGNNYGTSWKTVTLYDRTVYGVPAQDYKDIEFEMPKYQGIRNIKIEIGNPICK